LQLKWREGLHHVFPVFWGQKKLGSICDGHLVKLGYANGMPLHSQVDHEQLAGLVLSWYWNMTSGMMLLERDCGRTFGSGSISAQQQTSEALLLEAR
jgi:hypothetical protein